MILIIGSQEETHSKYMYDKMQSQNIDVAYFDSRLYPNELFISYGLGDDFFESYIKIQNKKIYLKDIQGVWWRWFYGISYVNFSGGNDEELDNIVYRECKVALENLFLISSRYGCNWLNSIEAINMHQTKGFQLQLLKEKNIRVPRTLFTNDPEAVRHFYEYNNKNIIYKPVVGGAYTQKMLESDFTNERMSAIKCSPIQLQECIDGVDIRVYVVGENIFAAKIVSNALDFREDLKASIVPIQLPKRVEKDCLKIIKLLKLRYSGIDIRLSDSGEYVFIEANPAPMFIHFEKKTKYPISDSIIKELISE